MQFLSMPCSEYCCINGTFKERYKVMSIIEGRNSRPASARASPVNGKLFSYINRMVKPLACFSYKVDMNGSSANTGGQTPWTYGRVVELSILNSSSSESSIEDSGIESPGAGSIPSSRNSPLSLSDAITSTSSLSSMLVSHICVCCSNILYKDNNVLCL